VLGGDREAFRVLVDRESAPVVRACHRILGDLHEAEDAAQEAFVIAYRSLASWQATGPFGAWLRRIAVRVALRRAGSRRPVVRLDSILVEPDGGRLPGSPAGATSLSPDPADVSVKAERADAVRRAVTALDEPYREVVLLRFFGDLSLAEIATATGRPVPTVKTHLRRGLLRLRQAAIQIGFET
jgi:RNA polymerase sigma-70 factor, ECF subfamily